MQTRTFRQVQEQFRAGFSAVPLVREFPADTLTPVEAFLRLTRPGEGSFLLESVEGGDRVARFSFLSSRPFETIVVRDGAAVVVDRNGSKPLAGPPLRAIAECLRRYQAPRDPDLPRFSGGAVGTISYGLAGRLEPSVRLKSEGEDEARLMIFGHMAAFDHARQRLLLIAHARRRPGVADRRAYAEAMGALDEMEARLSRPRRILRPRRAPVKAGAFPKGEMGERAFLERVLRLKRHIAAGDIFQGVLSERFEIPLRAPPFEVYRALRRVNPSPYMFFIDDGAQTALGASPEMLVRVENGGVETRPIAGTRRRGRNEEEDRRLEKNLLASPKERAEHLMLVDLGRNDVSRVSELGTVRVRSYRQVERYSHVMHLVSSVEGELRRGLSCWDAFGACFPAGTVTGAPKIRAMQLLSEIEPFSRGPYAGAVVYGDFRGNLDSAIAIRSLWTRRAGRKTWAQVQAGAGIVADSSPRRELDEVRQKARAMLRAIEIAESRR